MRRSTRAGLMVLSTAVPLLAFGPAERTAPTHWALVIGISDYVHLAEGEGGDLPGAEHDARRVRDVLVMRSGFPEENVRLVVNEEATREGIEEGVTRWLVERARPGDNVVIWYSGHGSQMWDEDGDEADGLDETLAPADVLPTSTERDISDDVFNEWLRMLPTENVIVVLDSCNSGTGTRAVTPFSRSRLLARDLARIQRPPSVARRELTAPRRDRSGFDAGRTRVLELAAAQPHQMAVEVFFPEAEGREAFHGGAFTTFMVRQLWKAPADMTYEEVFEEVHDALERNRFQQDPYISSDVALKSLPLFFVEGAATLGDEMTLPVTAASGERAELGAGLALGLTRGSILTTDRGARLLVSSVGQRVTQVSVLSGPVSEGDHARLVSYVFDPGPLLVDVSAVETRLVEALSAAIDPASAIRLVEDEDAFSHLLVQRRGQELRVLGPDGFARHGGIGVDPAEVTRLVDVLLKEAAAKRLGDMENPVQGFGLRVRLRGDQRSFGIGEEIAFVIESQRDGYVTLVDLGTDGTVAMLLPNADDPAIRIRAGETLRYPSGDLAFQALEPVGGGMVRAFLTDAPLDIAIPTGALYASGGAGFAEEITRAVEEAAGTDGEAVRLDTWGSASVVYEIIR